MQIKMRELKKRTQFIQQDHLYVIKNMQILDSFQQTVYIIFREVPNLMWTQDEILTEQSHWLRLQEEV